MKSKYITACKTDKGILKIGKNGIYSDSPLRIDQWEAHEDDNNIYTAYFTNETIKEEWDSIYIEDLNVNMERLVFNLEGRKRRFDIYVGDIKTAIIYSGCTGDIILENKHDNFCMRINGEGKVYRDGKVARGSIYGYDEENFDIVALNLSRNNTFNLNNFVNAIPFCDSEITRSHSHHYIAIFDKSGNLWDRRFAMINKIISKLLKDSHNDFLGVNKIIELITDIHTRAIKNNITIDSFYDEFIEYKGNVYSKNIFLLLRGLLRTPNICELFEEEYFVSVLSGEDYYRPKKMDFTLKEENPALFDIIEGKNDTNRPLEEGVDYRVDTWSNYSRRLSYHSYR